jgi:8-oxo-dGTP pyrophosphatase MutT (NUDIX family)
MPKNQPVERHFTATGFIIYNNYTLLHWHKKVNAWLPPGGHINKNEDPVQAVIREISEETGIKVSVVGNQFNSNFTEPKRILTPMAILIEDIDDPDSGHHQHIDLIYACQPKHQILNLLQGWYWVSREMLIARQTNNYNNKNSLVPPEDVRELALEAFEIVDSLLEIDH